MPVISIVSPILPTMEIGIPKTNFKTASMSTNISKSRIIFSSLGRRGKRLLFQNFVGFVTQQDFPDHFQSHRFRLGRNQHLTASQAFVDAFSHVFFET